MLAARPCALALALVMLAACGDDTASSGATSGTTTTTTASSTAADPDPTTTGSTTGSTTVEPVDPCECQGGVSHDGSLELADLAAYQGACLVEVTGSVELDGIEDPSVLTALTHLRRARRLSISNSPGVVNLAPVSCLREVESLSLYSNANLVDLGALERVEVAERINLRGVPIEALPRFAPNYQGVRTLYLADLPELRDLDPIAGWPGLHAGETYYNRFQITITDLPKLESLAGLAGPVGSALEKTSLDPADGWPVLDISELPALASVAGLETFTRGHLSLRHLPGIKDLAPLANLERAGGLTLAGFDSLSSLAGLQSLTRTGDLILGGCEDGDAMTSLATLAGLDALTEISRDLWIVDAPVLTDLTAPSLIAVESTNFVDTALDEAVIAAFNTKVDPTDTCAGDIVECSCLWHIPDSVSAGCPRSWSGGSAVAGTSPAGPFDGITAFFGWFGGTYVDTRLVLVILDAAADVEEAKMGGVSDNVLGRPKALLETNRPYFSWIGDGPSSVSLRDAEGELWSATVELDIQGRLGNWLTPDSADPPRLHGMIKSSDPNAPVLLDGPFDAVFCDHFTVQLSD